MKKIIIGLVLLFMASTELLAQTTTTTTTTKYWYYPSKNVYYNEASGDYWYYDSPTTKWVTIKQLPSTYVLSDNDTRYMVNYNGTDVWKYNKTHKTKYKVKKNGTVKTKTKPS